MITARLAVDFSSVVRSAGSLEAAIENISRPLARLGGHMRAKARRKFAVGGPGWVALAPATVARKMDAVENALLRKDKGGRSGVRSILAEARKLLRAETTMTTAKSQKVRDNASPRAFVGRASLDAIRKSASKGRRKFDSIARLVRYAERERDRAKRHGAALRAMKVTEFASNAERRKAGRIGQRRYRVSEHPDRILGDLSQTIDMAIESDGKSVSAFSKAYIGEIHNDGGTAGNGAKIPARPFMTLDAEDLERGAQYFREHMIDAWGESG